MNGSRMNSLKIALLVVIIFLQAGFVLGQIFPLRAFADPVEISVGGGKNPIVTLTGKASTSSSSYYYYTVPSNRRFIITEIYGEGSTVASTNATYRYYLELYNVTRGRAIWGGTMQSFRGYFFSDSYGTGYTNIFTPSPTQHFTTGIAIDPGTQIRVRGYGTFSISGYLAL